MDKKDKIQRMTGREELLNLNIEGFLIVLTLQAQLEVLTVAWILAISISDMSAFSGEQH